MSLAHYKHNIGFSLVCEEGAERLTQCKVCVFIILVATADTVASCYSNAHRKCCHGVIFT